MVIWEEERVYGERENAGIFLLKSLEKFKETASIKEKMRLNS